MRSKRSQKAEVHERILRAAARMMRASGPEKISVDALMRKAGLTHGGFYAHFKSRDAMVVETLGVMFGESERAMHLLFDGLPPRQALTKFINWYLSPEHREGAIPTCPVVAFSADLPRQSERFRSTFRSGLKRIVGILVDWMTAAGIARPQALAASLLSALAGSINVSRAVDDPHLADAILKATRESFLARLGLQDHGS